MKKIILLLIAISFSINVFSQVQNGNVINIGKYGGTAVTLGQKVSASSEPIVIASDQTAIPVGPIIPGTGSINSGKARNTAIGATDTGFEMLVLRSDLLTAFGTTGSYTTPIADKYGSLIVKDLYRQKTTYSTAFTVVPAATATDIFQIVGSATKTVMIQALTISGTQTTGGQATVIISKRSTANTLGTSTAAVLVSHDAADATATATALIYTANPTLGTSLGSVRVVTLPFGAASSMTNNIVQLNFGERGKPITLNGIAQCLSINLNGVTLVGGSINVWIEFTEE